MSSSRLELLRSAFEGIESFEKALAQAFAYKEKYVYYVHLNCLIQPKETVVCDLLIYKFQQNIQKKSKEILSIYNDQEGLLRDENDIFSGQKFNSEEQKERMVSQINNKIQTQTQQQLNLVPNGH